MKSKDVKIGGRYLARPFEDGEDGGGAAVVMVTVISKDSPWPFLAEILSVIDERIKKYTLQGESGRIALTANELFEYTEPMDILKEML